MTYIANSHPPHVWAVSPAGGSPAAAWGVLSQLVFSRCQRDEETSWHVLHDRILPAIETPTAAGKISFISKAGHNFTDICAILWKEQFYFKTVYLPLSLGIYSPLYM